MIVSFLNQKGGVGKTTLALNVAGELARMKRRVLLIDADPQGSALDWAAARGENDPPQFTVVGQPRATIHRDIAELSKGYRDVVIDAPPRATELVRSIIMASDIVVVPVQPSPYDVWAAEEIVKQLKEAATFKPNLKAAFAVNRSIVNTAIGRDVKASLGNYGYPILQGIVHQRVAFADSAASGRLVSEIEPRSLAAKEVSRLATSILEMTA